MIVFPKWIKPIERSPEGEKVAQRLRADGFITGMFCCLHCQVVSSFFIEEPGNPALWAHLQCAHCGHIGGLFKPDDECLIAP